MVWFKRVIAVRTQAPLGICLAALEDDVASAIRQGKVDPGSPLRIGGRELMPRQIPEFHGHVQAVSDDPVRQAQVHGAILEQVARLVNGRAQGLGLRHIDHITMPIHQFQHSCISADGHVRPHRGARLQPGRHGRNRSMDRYRLHVAGLARLAVHCVI